MFTESQVSPRARLARRMRSAEAQRVARNGLFWGTRDEVDALTHFLQRETDADADASAPCMWELMLTGGLN